MEVAGERIERRKGLVHQQHRGIVGERASDGDPLLHPTREVVRIRLCEFLKLHELELVERDRLALRPRHAFHFEPERDIAKRRAPREQLREILEHHAAVHA